MIKKYLTIHCILSDIQDTKTTLLFRAVKTCQNDQTTTFVVVTRERGAVWQSLVEWGSSDGEVIRVKQSLGSFH